MFNNFIQRIKNKINKFCQQQIMVIKLFQIIGILPNKNLPLIRKNNWLWSAFLAVNNALWYPLWDGHSTIKVVAYAIPITLIGATAGYVSYKGFIFIHKYIEVGLLFDRDIHGNLQYGLVLKPRLYSTKHLTPKIDPKDNTQYFDIHEHTQDHIINIYRPNAPGSGKIEPLQKIGSINFEPFIKKIEMWIDKKIGVPPAEEVVKVVEVIKEKSYQRIFYSQKELDEMINLWIHSNNPVPDSEKTINEILKEYLLFHKPEETGIFKIFEKQIPEKFAASPLDQFDIYSWINFSVFNITNIHIQIILIIILFFLRIAVLKYKFLNPYMLIRQKMYSFINNIMSQNINSINKINKYLPLFFIIFLFILLSNIIGLFPYHFTLTSHFSLIFYVAFILFVGFNIKGWYLHNITLFGLILPNGAPLIRAPFLIFIETISYLARIISLATRLFANRVAGHTLLKILSGFRFILRKIKPYVFFLIPLIIILTIFGLEFIIAVLQTYVFITLLSIYRNDAEIGSH